MMAAGGSRLDAPEPISLKVKFQLALPEGASADPRKGS